MFHVKQFNVNVNVMKNISQVIEEYKVQVESSFPSIFTKVDVIQLLNSMEVELQKVPRGTSEFESHLIQEIKDRVEEVVDGSYIEDNVTLDLNGNCIEVSYDTDGLVRELKNSIENVYDEVCRDLRVTEEV